MTDIKIGCLLPVSGVMPSMSKDFKRGLELGLADVEAGDFNVEVVPELINQGQIQNVSEGLNKLVGYHGVDLLTGIVSSLVIRELLDTINNKKVPFIYNNLGEYVPSEIDSSFLFRNSLHLWQSQWAMGKWAQQEYGGTPAICFSVYDAGYHLHEAFRLGAMAGGASTTQFNMLPLIPNKIDTTPLIELIDHQRPDHVHAILCGVDGKDFLKRYSDSGFLDKIPLTVCPFLVEDNLTSGIEGLISDIPNSTTWSYQVKNSGNEEFINMYEKSYTKKPSVFSVLGYESGLAVIHALEVKRARGISLETAISEVKVSGPRGRVVLNTSGPGKIYIRKPQPSEDKSPVNQVIDELESVDQNHPDMLSIAESGVSGWQNPYLCI